ncbi:STAS-like domain-containing protein [Eikenella corrodens]|uniref:STAS-like domain-containing protein n=1 Tax=Eikenella corrodens TaxID=539 RepID=UPI0024202B74|nr:STAS-like domain-containing protein [Eikenella corrodens]
MKDKVMILNVASDFSPFPAGRFKADGPYSGEAFRDEKLLPALQDHQTVQVILDGALGYGSSFLEEVFGGLVRLNRWPTQDLLDRIQLVSDEEPALIEEIKGYMQDAAK